MPNELYDLEVWQIAHKIALDLYRFTSSFPSEERFELVSQLRRALVSIELNIAEDHGRYHDKDAVNFFINARGSVSEVRAALLISKDLGYIEPVDCEKLDNELVSLTKRLNS